MSAPTLAFLKNEAGEKEGLGDAGIETFRTAPYASAAREAGQNSRDAAESLPVVVTFDVIKVPQQQIPAHDDVLNALKACELAAEQEKEVEFINNAQKVMSAPEIPVLCIADYNTWGLKGPPEKPGTPFHSLLKSSGISTKDSQTSGGSFGIGKNASFAVSDLQMVLYATRYADDEGNEVYAAQGKIKLMSHVDGDGESRRATGYWGDPNGYVAVSDPSLVPGWLQRAKRGTSIFCVGFREIDDWAALMASSIVTHFFCAVHRKEMLFEVAAGAHKVNHNTIEALLTDDNIRSAADRSGRLQDLDFSAQLYRCLVSPLAEEHTLSIPNLGEVRARILLEPGLPRRIAFIRNGMFITDHLKNFGHPLIRFPGSRDFVALVEPVGEDAAKFMKRLENPAHDELSAARMSDPDKRKISEAAMKELGKQLRSLIKHRTGLEQHDAVALDELARFFSHGNATSPSAPKHGENDPEAYTVTRPMLRTVRRGPPKPNSGEEGGGGSSGNDGADGGGSSGPRSGDGRGGHGNRGLRETLHLGDVRNIIVLDSGGATKRKIHFTPDVDGCIAITLEAPGLNETVPIKIVGADQGHLNQGILQLVVKKQQRTTVVLHFSEPYEGPVEMIATAEAAIGEHT